MAVGAYALITLQVLKDHLGITASTDDTILERFIDRATDRIEQWTGRRIVSRTIAEWQSAGGGRSIRLRQWPATAIHAVFTGSRTALTVSSTDASDIRVTVGVNIDLDNLANASLVISRMAAGGVVTTSTLAFSTYTDVTSLVAAVNALTGVSASVVFDCPTQQLHPRAGGDAKIGPVHVTCATVGSDYTFDASTGVVWLDAGSFPPQEGPPSRFPYSPQSVFVRYVAGYSTVPDDLQEACCELAAMLYMSRKQDRSVASESLGDYSFTRADAASATTILESMLSQWKDIR